ncbi:MULTISPECIES: MerR family transcriptional regulator [Arthrobacter]|jgi:DNA-binding transcriptional MerR regulator|uniref:DNA-binding transcriptional MerR regulator n=1 Tax=Arthrobacter bambusae TaxID=1338426 RepID=A0AAW8DGH9_9MICC|nr:MULTISPECIES: MerR family transcriptional regulator [Arthrobacter]MDP9905415.1 DNA-binding transcriptional MerR regulator [Arthrobacter bambusae]MDQ0129107.1 DNA-binding transcriptional MerR regulator [Arthrobacter bambusae]MDQ0180547.1 DNA-binding transcriptional MerR regulator [Arthrobacter bambusae]MDQ0242311.1 DNA-binding transcriptional MerR regulator [Arthrobacter bambusae]
MAGGNDAGRGVYAISVAAELVGMGQQNLRLYERRGLIEPGRTLGGTRQYSEEDLATLRRIGELLDLGLNLAGIGMVLRLEAENRRLQRELRSATAERANARTRSG